MSNNKNVYARKHKKNSLLGNITAEMETKGDGKASAIETFKDLVIGVVGGGLVGSAIGKYSLLAGAAVTGTGYYIKNKLVTSLGFGMMAANGFQKKEDSVSGLDGETAGLEGAKERVLAFKDTFSQKLFLDKLVKKKPESGTNGVGEVQYFVYPNQNLEGKELDMSALERLENQVAQSGMEYGKHLQSGESEDESTGEIGEVGQIDLSEEIY